MTIITFRRGARPAWICPWLLVRLIRKGLITSRFAELDESIERPRRLQKAWEDDEIVFDGFDGRFVHTKIELDGEGHGSIGLS